MNILRGYQCSVQSITDWWGPDYYLGTYIDFKYWFLDFQLLNVLFLRHALGILNVSNWRDFYRCVAWILGRESQNINRKPRPKCGKTNLILTALQAACLAASMIAGRFQWDGSDPDTKLNRQLWKISKQTKQKQCAQLEQRG